MSSTTKDDEIFRRWRREVAQRLPAVDRELADEIAQFLADRWQRACADGANPDSADRLAFADLREWQRRDGAPVSRREWPALWMGWSTDLRLGLRALVARPTFASATMLLTAIAVAATVIGSGLYYGILVRPLPYPNADRLAVLWQVSRGEATQISYPDLADLGADSVFETVSAMTGGRGSLRVNDDIHRINLIELEPTGFDMLGATPHTGRLLTAADADQPVAMVSHRLWTTVLGSDPEVVGKLIWLSGRDLTVVGVLREGFDVELPVPPAFRREKNDVWMVLQRRSPFLTRRDVSGYEALVRRAPGRSLRDAQSAADAIAARLAVAHPSTNTGRTFRVADLTDEVVARVRRPMVFVAVAAVVTLIIALVNLTILGLGRASDRAGELAIRRALGAGTFRLRRQLVTEYAVIAGVGAAGGTWAAALILEALRHSDAAQLPRAGSAAVDMVSVAAALVVALLVTITLATPPLRDRFSTLHSGARVAGRRMQRVRRLLVGTEVALALTLATGGALLVLSLARLLAVDPGFTPAGAATARVSAYAARYPTRAATVQFFDDLVQTLRMRADVTAAAAGYSLPLSGQMTGTAVIGAGMPVSTGPAPTAGWQFVTPEYFAALGMQIRAGRDFTPQDRDRAGHVAIINEDLARAVFPGLDPIGRRIGVGGGEQRGDWHEVVGVVADVRHQALDVAPAPRVYDLFGQHFERTLYVVVRGRQADASSLVGAIKGAVRALDPEAPVFEAAALQELVNRSAAPRRLATVVATGLSLAAVLLALVGVSAVAAAAVAERVREIGVRAALGAAPRDLYRLILGEGAWTVAIGAAAGLFGSAGVVRLLDAQLFGTRVADAFWLVPLVTSAVIIVGIGSTLPAARRAARVDPLIAIRSE